MPRIFLKMPRVFFQALRGVFKRAAGAAIFFALHLTWAEK